MRKVWWCCAASAAMAVTGSLCGVGVYAKLHPDSKVAHVASQVYRLGSSLSPLSRITSVAARQTRGVYKTVKDRVTSGSVESEVQTAPSCPASEEPCEPQQVVEETPPSLAGQIVIGEEEPLCPPANAWPPCELPQFCETPCRPPVNEQAVTEFGGIEECETGPKPMPYCREPAEKQSIESIIESWLSLFGFTKDACGAVEECEQPLPCTPPGNCQEDPYHDLHYPGCPHTGYQPIICPYTGKCYPRDEVVDEPQTNENTPESRSSPSPKQSTSPEGKCQPEQCPKHPEVDTMEFRKSDAGFADYFGLIPF